MTHYPQQTKQRPAARPSGSAAPAKPGLLRDLVWGRPVFKAPELPNPRVAFDPLPFSVTRPARSKAARQR